VQQEIRLAWHSVRVPFARTCVHTEHDANAMRTRSPSGCDRVPIAFVSGCLGNKRLSTTDWKDRAAEEQGVSKTRFFALLKELTDAKKVSKSEKIDR